MEDYGIKELYGVAIKAIMPLQIGEQHFEPDEVILRFDRLQIAMLRQNSRSYNATGGNNQGPLIEWKYTTDTNFTCSMGVLSETSLALLSNSKVFVTPPAQTISLPITGEVHECDINGLITLKHLPNGKGFIYNAKTGEKLFSNLDRQTYTVDTTIVADYSYDYNNGSKTIEIGHNLFGGYVKLEGKMRFEDDMDGLDKTCLITIPKVKIESNLTLRLGKLANPTVGYFNFTGYPVGDRGSRHVCLLTVLNDDIDSDF